MIRNRSGSARARRTRAQRSGCSGSFMTRIRPRQSTFVAYRIERSCSNVSSTVLFGLLRQHLLARLTGAPVIDVSLERIDLPQSLVGVHNPELGLPSIATFNSLLALGANARLFQTHLHSDQGSRIGHAESKMVEHSASAAWSWLQRQYQRRIVQLKLGVIGPVLGRLAAEQDSIESYRTL